MPNFCSCIVAVGSPQKQGGADCYTGRIDIGSGAFGVGNRLSDTADGFVYIPFGGGAIEARLVGCKLRYAETFAGVVTRWNFWLRKRKCLGGADRNVAVMRSRTWSKRLWRGDMGKSMEMGEWRMAAPFCCRGINGVVKSRKRDAETLLYMH